MEKVETENPQIAFCLDLATLKIEFGICFFLTEVKLLGALLKSVISDPSAANKYPHQVWVFGLELFDSDYNLNSPFSPYSPKAY